MRITRRFLVSGRVQGVGFRFFVLTQANRLGLHGWVRNLPGGHVEALAEGDGDTLEEFERHLRQGPPASRVDRMLATDAAGEIHSGFTIR